MSWTTCSSTKLARLLKTTCPSMALARSFHSTQRTSSSLVDIIKGAATGPPSYKPRPNITIGSDRSSPLGLADSPQPPSSVWDSVTKNLSQMVQQARANTLVHSGEPPESIWKRRSDEISTKLRLIGMSDSGPRPPAGGAKKFKGYGDNIGLNEAEVPFVASGRTITSGDFGKAVIRLNQILQRNRVRQEWRRDKYFTKPFELRYQLRSRRHRQRFAAEIRRKVQIVQAIKRRGM